MSGEGEMFIPLSDALGELKKRDATIAALRAELADRDRVIEAAKWVVHLFFDEIVLDSVNDRISKQIALDQLAVHVRALDGEPKVRSESPPIPPEEREATLRSLGYTAYETLWGTMWLKPALGDHELPSTWRVSHG